MQKLSAALLLTLVLLALAAGVVWFWAHEVRFGPEAVTLWFHTKHSEVLGDVSDQYLHVDHRFIVGLAGVLFLLTYGVLTVLAAAGWNAGDPTDGDPPDRSRDLS